MAGPVTMGGAPLLSAVWFPVHQRTTATALGVLSGTLGVAVSFIIGNLIGVLQPSATFCSTSHKIKAAALAKNRIGLSLGTGLLFEKIILNLY